MSTDLLRRLTAQALVVAALWSAASHAGAANAFRLAGGPLLVDGGSQELALLLDSDIRVFAFSFGVAFDPDVFTFTGATLDGTLAEGADFFTGGVSPVYGVAGFGCVLDFLDARPPGVDPLPPGRGLRIATLLVEPTTAVPAESTVTLRDVVIGAGRPVGNVVIDAAGRSFPAAGRPLTVRLVSRRFVRGDCNGDGALQPLLADVVFLLEHTFAGTVSPGCLAACDANGDRSRGGAVVDALYLLSHGFLGGPPPPPPFPGCGEPRRDGAPELPCDAPAPVCSG